MSAWRWRLSQHSSDLPAIGDGRNQSLTNRGLCVPGEPARRRTRRTPFPSSGYIPLHRSGATTLRSHVCRLTRWAFGNEEIEQRGRQEVMEKLKGISRHYMLVAAASVLVLIGAAGLSPTRAQETDFGGPRWVATWGVPPMAHGSAFGASRSFENQTVRHRRLIIGSAHIAVQSTGASIVPESDRTRCRGSGLDRRPRLPGRACRSSLGGCQSRVHAGGSGRTDHQSTTTGPDRSSPCVRDTVASVSTGRVDEANCGSKKSQHARYSSQPLADHWTFLA
jgi:hypothetical protein